MKYEIRNTEMPIPTTNHPPSRAEPPKPPKKWLHQSHLTRPQLENPKKTNERERRLIPLVHLSTTLLQKKAAIHLVMYKLERTNSKTAMHVSDFIESHREVQPRKKGEASSFSIESIIEKTGAVLEERKRRRIESGELGVPNSNRSSSPKGAPPTVAGSSGATVTEEKSHDDKIIDSIKARAHVLFASSPGEYAEFRDKIFEAFQRIETTTTTINEEPVIEGKEGKVDDYNLGDTIPDY
jgi:hypothetical protein